MYTLEIEGTPGYKQISNLSAAVIMHNQLFPEKPWGVDIIRSLSPEKYNPFESMVDWLCRTNKIHISS